MVINAYIGSHERHEALEAYRQWLSVEQESAIKDAPPNAVIKLERSNGQTSISVIEEG